MSNLLKSGRRRLVVGAVTASMIVAGGVLVLGGGTSGAKPVPPPPPSLSLWMQEHPGGLPIYSANTKGHMLTNSDGVPITVPIGGPPPMGAPGSKPPGQ